jgi:hypothetical protein
MLMGLVAGLNVTGQTRSGELPGQDKRKPGGRDGVRTVVIPVTIRTKGARMGRELAVVNFTVREDGEEMRKLSIRWLGNSPLTLSVLIQDGIVPSIGNEMKAVGEFIRSLPEGSRVFVGFANDASGNLTSDLVVHPSAASRNDTLYGPLPPPMTLPSFDAMVYGAAELGTNLNAPLGSGEGPGFNFDNQTAYKVGLTWQATPALALRAGYVYANRVVNSTETLFGVLGCVTGRYQYSAGATWAREPANVWPPASASSTWAPAWTASCGRPSMWQRGGDRLMPQVRSVVSRPGSMGRRSSSRCSRSTCLIGSG